MEFRFFDLKVPDSGCTDGELARRDVQTLDGQADMSKKGDSPDCECWRRLRERGSAEQSTFKIK